MIKTLCGFLIIWASAFIYVSRSEPAVTTSIVPETSDRKVELAKMETSRKIVELSGRITKYAEIQQNQKQTLTENTSKKNGRNNRKPNG